MSLIGEADIGSPLIHEALEAAPSTTLTVEDIVVVDGETRLVVWATGDDLDAFEVGLDADPTVRHYRFLTAVDDRRLYRVTLSDAGLAVATHPTAFSEDIVILDHRVTVDGMQVRARIPDRAALAAYREACREQGVSFELTKLYRVDEPTTAVENAFGVTAAQREALVHALEAGYFDVPRDTDLQTMAAALDVSPQALSTRLRRGQANLVGHAFSPEGI